MKNAPGATPTAVAGDNDWALYRAYTTLANWESQSENAIIDIAVRNFDNPRPDLVAAGAVMNVACYGDGPDRAAVTINGWTTGPETYINIFTPVLPGHVGTTQRHSGVWDATKYRLVGSTHLRRAALDPGRLRQGDRTADREHGGQEATKPAGIRGGPDRRSRR